MDGEKQAGKKKARHGTVPSVNVEPSPFATTATPLRKHEGPAFVVYSEIVLPTVTEEGQMKGPPQIRLRWKFKPGFSGRIVGYRRANAFGKAGDFGELIVNSTVDGKKSEHLPPAEYFYSFFTGGSILGLVHTFSNDLQFSETVPSAASILAMMQNAISFTEIRQKFVKLVKPPQPPEDPHKSWTRQVEAELATMDLRVKASEDLRKQWQATRRSIEESDLPKGEKQSQLDLLDGIMQQSREKLGL